MALQFEEEGDAGFRFTRKKSRQHRRSRRSSAYRGVDAAELKEIREREDLDRPEASPKAIAPPTLPLPSSAPCSQEDIELYQSEIEESRAFLAAAREEVAAWQSSIEEHEAEVDETRRNLQAAQSDFVGPLSHDALMSRISDDHRQRFQDFSDGSQVRHKVEEMNQRLSVVTDRLGSWNRLCDDLAEYSGTVVKQRRQEIAATARGSLGSNTPVKISMLVSEEATPTMRVLRRRRNA